MHLGELLAEQLDDTRDWTLKLIADLEGADWAFQPAPGLAHATWLCGHLAVAEDLLINVRCLGAGLLDAEFASRFPIGVPVESHGYPSPDTILATMADVHARTLAALRAADDALWSAPAFGKDGAVHPHYRDKRGAAAHCARHEAFHAGQLATLRRLRGKPFLR